MNNIVSTLLVLINLLFFSSPIYAQTDLTGATITLSKSYFVYDGTAHEPTVTGIRKGSLRYTSLVAGVDYDISYKYNVHAGEAIATISFKGNYTGVVTKTFYIDPLDLTYIVTLELNVSEDIFYDGTKKTPKASDIYYKDKLLVPGTDYDLMYNNNIDPGIATATAVFKGNYKGKISAKFYIIDPNVKGTIVNKTNFPDNIFRNWILAQNYGSDGILTEDEITNVTSINVTQKKIQNLKGIEYFTALTSLYCYQNQLSSLDVSQNTGLKDLNCYDNQLTSLDVSQNTRLGSLSCSNNQLTSLDVSNSTELSKLSCSNNKLTSLDVSQNTRLGSLSCSNNQLTSLDVSNNTKLNKIECNNNLITSLNVSGCTILEILNCYTNQLTSLDVSQNTRLVYLYCNNNLLTSLDVSNNTRLGYLSCYDNHLTSLDVSKNTELSMLSCSNNKLTSLDVSQNTELGILDCYNNQLSSLDVSQNTSLYTIYCGQNRIRGKNMDATVENLPYSSYGSELYVIYNENEGNTMNTLQVDIAKSKGWKVYHCTGKSYIEEYDAYEENWEEYSGSKPYLRGDVNNDAEIGMPDVMFVVNYILGTPAEDFNAEAADVNLDGEIGMPDVMFIVNYILNGKFPDEEE